LKFARPCATWRLQTPSGSEESSGSSFPVCRSKPGFYGIGMLKARGKNQPEGSISLLLFLLLSLEDKKRKWHIQ